MTGQTIGTAVDVAGNIVVLFVHLRLAMFVAGQASKDAEVRAVRMACITGLPDLLAVSP